MVAQPHPNLSRNMLVVLLDVPEKRSINVCFKNPSKDRVRQNLITWMTEGIHKVAVGGGQKKPFEQLIFQWISDPSMARYAERVCVEVWNYNYNDLLL